KVTSKRRTLCAAEARNSKRAAVRSVENTMDIQTLHDSGLNSRQPKVARTLKFVAVLSRSRRNLSALDRKLWRTTVILRHPHGSRRLLRKHWILCLQITWLV